MTEEYNHKNREQMKKVFIAISIIAVPCVLAMATKSIVLGLVCVIAAFALMLVNELKAENQ
jgi:hypothetical protein